ncbi:hypothetical protein K439DRAFT_1617363 [Ramaria rubella]|nr:hypothetical protein K439DRAFT_1617363 [Ramaria rubella]
MPRKSKSVQKRLQNLPQLRILHKVTVEEVPDEAFTLETMPMAMEGDSDDEYDEDDEIIANFEVLENEGFVECDEEDSEDDDEEAEAESKDDATLLLFSQTLQKAHDVAVAAEQEKEAGQKRKKHYTGNSQRSKERWASKRRMLQVPGKKVFISDFFKQSRKETEVIYASSDELEELSESHAPTPAPALNRVENYQDKSTSIEHNDNAAAGNRSPEDVTIPSSISELLSNLRDDTHKNGTDQVLGSLGWQDFPSLRRVRAKLTVKSQDKKLDVFFWA